MHAEIVATCIAIYVKVTWTTDIHIMLQGPTIAELLDPFPRVQSWMTRVAKSTDPHWKTVSAILHKVALRGKDRKSKAAPPKL